MGDISENGSCWDEGPTVPVQPGELMPLNLCGPMPPRCELKAGHLGAHQSGLTKWMRRPANEYNRVTRVTIVTSEGVAFEKYNLYRGGVELSLQDDGRTLKIFPKESA